MWVPLAPSSSILRRRDDTILRRVLVIGGVLLAASMLILSTQTSRARSAPEVTVEAVGEPQPIIETAAL